MKAEYEQPSTQVYLIKMEGALLQESLGEWNDPDAGPWIP